jgi:hypothetical protein
LAFKRGDATGAFLSFVVFSQREVAEAFASALKGIGAVVEVRPALRGQAAPGVSLREPEPTTLEMESVSLDEISGSHGLQVEAIPLPDPESE